MVFRLIVSAACIAVIAAVAAWFYDRHEAETERSAIISNAACSEAAERWQLAKRGKRDPKGDSPATLLADYNARCGTEPSDEDRWYVGVLK